MNLKLAPKGEETKKGLELTGKGEAPSGIAECAKGKPEPEGMLNSSSTDLCTWCPSCCCPQVSFFVCTCRHSSVLPNAVTAALKDTPCVFCGWLATCVHTCLPAVLCSTPALSIPLHIYVPTLPGHPKSPYSLELSLIIACFFPSKAEDDSTSV